MVWLHVCCHIGIAPHNSCLIKANSSHSLSGSLTPAWHTVFSLENCTHTKTPPWFGYVCPVIGPTVLGLGPYVQRLEMGLGALEAVHFGT